jgi:hypothetical protein
MERDYAQYLAAKAVALSDENAATKAIKPTEVATLHQ